MLGYEDIQPVFPDKYAECGFLLLLNGINKSTCKRKTEVTATNGVSKNGLPPECISSDELLKKIVKLPLAVTKEKRSGSILECPHRKIKHK